MNIRINAAILILLAFVFSCKKEKVNDEMQNEYCDYINQLEFENTKDITNFFLATLPANHDEENLMKLKDWLELKQCVVSAKVLCNSCIETLPLQSELGVEYKNKDTMIYKVMDISMGNPLTLRAFH